MVKVGTGRDDGFLEEGANTGVGAVADGPWLVAPTASTAAARQLPEERLDGVNEGVEDREDVAECCLRGCAALMLVVLDAKPSEARLLATCIMAWFVTL